MSGSKINKVISDQKFILSHNCHGRSTLEKILIPAAIILLSGCILFGVLYFTNLNSEAAEADTTTPASVLGAAIESSGKDETEPGSSVKETADDTDSTLTLVTDASDADVSDTGVTTKSTTKAAAATAGTNAATVATTSWSAATITPTTTAAETSFSLSGISIPDFDEYSDFSIDPDTSYSLPDGLDTNMDGYDTISSIT